MLSGYVMARTYESRFAEGLGAGSFFTLRYLRLWPTMAVGAIIGSFYLATSTNEFWLAMAANLLLIPYFVNHQPFGANWAAWSIFYELVANVAHAAWFCRIKKLILPLALLGTGILVISLDFPSFTAGHKDSTFAAGFVRVFFSYLIGVQLHRSLGSRSVPTTSSILILSILPLIFVTTWFLPQRSTLLDMLIVAGVFPCLIAAGTSISVGAGLKWLGRISFPLYAVHWPLMAFCHIYGWSVLWSVPVAFALASLMPDGLRLKSLGKVFQLTKEPTTRLASSE